MGNARLKDATDLVSYLKSSEKESLLNGMELEKLKSELYQYRREYDTENNRPPNIGNPNKLRSDLRGLCEIAYRHIGKNNLPKKIQKICSKVR